MAQIPPETIQEVLDKTDIVELIGSYIELKRASGMYEANCPFHMEKTPSFKVNVQRQRYKCFGCGESGDAISFVKEYEGLPFVDAVHKLADRAGVTIMEQAFDPRAEARKRTRNQLVKLQKDAAEFFNMLLMKKEVAAPAREYLKGRGINSDVAKRWKFGYAPENQQMFFQWARSAGYEPQVLVDGGLAAYPQDNPHRGAYARFRHRLMFPVANNFGDTIAFSGRVLSKDQKGGKYVNSPETPIFDKSKTFFGFEKTKRAVMRANRAIVFEGQLDLIAAYEAGIDTGVAALGTAFTENHAKLLKRHADETVLCFDSDRAGVAAAVKAYRVLAPTGMLVRIALLPVGEDPDSLIQKEGPAVLEEILSEAPEYFDFQIDRRGSALTTGPLRDRLNYAKELAFDIALIEDKMIQDSLVNRISVRLKVGEDEIRRHVSNAKRDQVKGERARQRREIAMAARESNNSGRGGGGQGGQWNGADFDGPEVTAPPVEITNKSILFLCQLLLISPEVKQKYQAEPVPEFFANLPETELLTMLWRSDFDPSRPSNISAFSATLTPGERTVISNLLDAPVPVAPDQSVAGKTGDSGEMMPDPAHLQLLASTCLQKLHRQSLERRQAEIKARLGAPDISPEEIVSLQKEKIDLMKRLNDIPRHFSD